MNYIFQTVLLALLLSSCAKKQPSAHPTQGDITESVYASGIVKARDQYTVYAPVSGLIQTIYVTKGQFVQQGAPLFSIASATADLNLQNARLTARNASAQASADRLKELQANVVALGNKLQMDSVLLERQKRLWAENIGTRNELEQRELSYKNDLQSYLAAVAHLADAKRQVSYNEQLSKNNVLMNERLSGDFIVRSKSAGRVYSINKEEGEMVTNQTPVAIIGAAAQFLLELQVDEYDISKIKTGQQVIVGMDSYKRQFFEATVTNIIPIMNDRTRSFTIEANFLQPPAKLFPNLTADASIVVGHRTNAITIPRDYLLNDSLVVLASGKQRHVQTGAMDYERVEIIRCLQPNESIIKPSP